MGTKSSNSKGPSPHMDQTSMSAAAQAAQLMFKKAELQQQHQQQLQQQQQNFQLQQPMKINTSNNNSSTSAQQKKISRSLSHNSIVSASSTATNGSHHLRSPSQSSNVLKKPSISKSHSARVSLHSHLSSPPNVERSTGNGSISGKRTSVSSSSGAGTGKELTTSPILSAVAPSMQNTKKQTKKKPVKQTWNQVNANSSSIALAAASLIAKQNPTKMGPKESFNKEVVPKVTSKDTPVSPRSALTAQLNFKDNVFKDNNSNSTNITTTTTNDNHYEHNHSPKMVGLSTIKSASNNNNNSTTHSDTESSNISHLGISPSRNLSSSSVHSAISHNHNVTTNNTNLSPSINGGGLSIGTGISLGRKGSTSLTNYYTDSRANSTESFDEAEEDEEFMPVPLEISHSDSHSNNNITNNNTSKVNNNNNNANSSTAKFNYEVPSLKSLQSTAQSHQDFPYPPSTHPYYNLFKRPSEGSNKSKTQIPVISVENASIGTHDDVDKSMKNLQIDPSADPIKASPKLQPSSIPGTSVPLSKRVPPPPVPVIASVSDGVDSSSPEMVLSSRFNESDMSLDSPDETPDYEEYISRGNSISNFNVNNNIIANANGYKTSIRPSFASEGSSTSSLNKMSMSNSDIAGNAASLAAKHQQHRMQQEQQRQQLQQKQQQKQRPSFISLPSSTTLTPNAQSEESEPTTPHYPICKSEDVKLPHHHHGPLRGKHSKQIKKIFGMKNESLSSMTSQEYFPNVSSPSYGMSTPSGVNSGNNDNYINYIPGTPNGTSNSLTYNNSSTVSLLQASSPQQLQPLPQPTSQKLKFKTTMRKEKHTKSQFNESKPWKHHTASDTMTEEEKKRYEGVWAANKGSIMDRDSYLMEGFDQYAVLVYDDGTVVEIDEDNYSDDEEEGDDDEDDDEEEVEVEGEEEEDEASDTNEERYMKGNSTTVTTSFDKGVKFELLDLDLKECVHGLVVREIWRRSRLSDDTLERIWDLLINRRSDEFKNRNLQIGSIDDIEFDFGILSKKEFILGMWLVDQCLYGKKLPKSITADLWASVEEKAGIKVQNIKPKKKGKHRKKMLRRVVGRGSKSKNKI